MAELDELIKATSKAERELLIACDCLYLATDRKVADDVKAKAIAVIKAHTTFNRALVRRHDEGH